VAKHYRKNDQKKTRASGGKRYQSKQSSGSERIAFTGIVKDKPSAKPAGGARYKTSSGKTEKPAVIAFRSEQGREPISPDALPTSVQLEAELDRVKNKKENNRLIRNIILALITVAAVAVLVATLILPILQIYGNSMTPTLNQGDVVVSVKGSGFERGDIVSFYYNNKILVKRVIAFEGEYVNIGKDGTVFINNQAIDEPYLTDGEKAFGECDIELPYQVPAGRIFVLGDHRATSVDSRSSALGCVAEEQLVGKVVFRVWPLNHLGGIE